MWEKATFEYFNRLAEKGETFVRKTETKYGWNVDGSYNTPISASFLPNVSPSESIDDRSRGETRTLRSAPARSASVAWVFTIQAEFQLRRDRQPILRIQCP